MSQIEVAQIIEQIKQEITVDSNGQGKASIRATARLADVNDAGLLRSLKTAADNSGSKLVEKLVRKGFEGADILGWSQSGIPDLAVAAILHYYGFEAGKRCTQQARLACEAFESIGVRAWMQDIMGWTKPATQPKEQPTTPALPPVEQRLHTLVLAMKTLAELTGGRLNPYTEQQFKDYAGNLLAEHNRKLLTPFRRTLAWRGQLCRERTWKESPYQWPSLSRTLGDMGSHVLPTLRRSPRDTISQWRSTAHLCLRLSRAGCCSRLNQSCRRVLCSSQSWCSAKAGRCFR
ncbi:MAG: hypothetical protein ACYTXF_28545 [Nostoc sp.]